MFLHDRVHFIRVKMQRSEGCQDVLLLLQPGNRLVNRCLKIITVMLDLLTLFDAKVQGGTKVRQPLLGYLHL